MSSLAPASTTSNLQSRLTSFYQSISAYPLNIETVVLHIGHKSDFVTESAYLDLTTEYIRTHNLNTDDPFTSDDYNQFSQWL